MTGRSGTFTSGKVSKRPRTSRALSPCRLPRRGYVIREKHLRRYRTLTRELPQPRREPVFAGLLNMGDEGNAIWVEAGLPQPEKRFTIGAGACARAPATLR
jgi:hypothetical protein